MRMVKWLATLSNKMMEWERPIRMFFPPALVLVNLICDQLVSSLTVVIIFIVHETARLLLEAMPLKSGLRIPRHWIRYWDGAYQSRLPPCTSSSITLYTD